MFQMPLLFDTKVLFNRMNLFNLSGDHLIRAIVSNDNEIKTAEWDVNVHSIIWWWWPHELELSAPQDTTMEFVVFPFNEESDSLEYSWFLNDEVLDCDSSMIEIPFPETGEFAITAFVNEGIEADTVSWLVEVQELNQISNNSDFADVPTTPLLYPPHPNPFNSSIKISFNLPDLMESSLRIFDINGKLVTDIFDGQLMPGKHVFSWQPDNLPTGVYFVKYGVNGFVQNQKILLLR